MAVVTKTPAHAVPLQVLTRLREFGLRTDFTSLEVTGRAASYRAMANSAVYPSMMAELTRAKASRYTNLSPYLRWWTAGGILGHLTATKEHIEFIACAPPVENFGLQRWAANLLYSSVPVEILDDCIAKRLSTLLKVPTTRAIAATARTRIRDASGLVPPCAVASALRTICNAWTTSGRFSGPTAICPFGCGTPEADRFSHFPGCCALKEMWQEVCPAEAQFFRTLSLSIVSLAVPVMSTREVVMAVLWSDVVGQCLNDVRAASTHQYIGRDALVARLRFLGVQCDNTRALISTMRNPFVPRTAFLS